MIKEITEADKIINEKNDVTYDKVEELRTQAEKCTSGISEISVESSRKTHSREDVYVLLAEATSLLSEGQEKLKSLYHQIPTEDRNLKIYFDKKIFHLSNANLQIKWGLSKSQINRICKKIKENHNMRP